MTNRSSFPVSFDWSVADQTAIYPLDYDRHAPSGSVMIPAGGGPEPHQESFAFPIVNDMLTEPDETFGLSIGNVEGANIEKGTGIVTILANDPMVDIDVDSNNDGSITQADDPIEMDAPGNVILHNRDDDDGNGVPDYQDTGPVAVPDDDLLPVNIAFIQAGLPQDELDQLVVRLIYSENAISVWDTPTKNHRIISDRWWTIDQFSQLPSTLYMEGIGSFAGTLTLSLHRLEGDVSLIIVPDFGLETLVHSDSVQVTVSFVDLTGYTPYTEPFQLRPIPDANEENPGVHIRRNGDDDNGNGVPDRNDTTVASENDLIRVRISTAFASIPGLRLELGTSTNDIRIWTQPTKVNQLIGTNNPGQIILNWVPADIWVEWITQGTAPAASNLNIRLIDDVSNNVVATDTLVFHPFRSVAIVLGGRNQIPSDPPDPDHGMFETAIELYRQNYDVHMYHEDVVVPNATASTGAALDEVRNAIANRGVTSVASLGYSWGGGATFNLSGQVHRLRPNLNFNIGFTAYVDAIEQKNLFVLNNAETRRPDGSDYHLNIYEPNDSFLPGAATVGVNPNDLNINTETAPGFTRGLDHYTIDNDDTVQEFLEDDFRDKMNR
jgi:hypothetical protein